MKKILILILILSLSLLTLFSCGGKCTEHIDSDGNLKCDKCEADLPKPECTDHKYDNNCDKTCNNEGCDYTREVGDHTDSNNDGLCDSCTATVTPPVCTHTDTNTDGKCDSCGDNIVVCEGHSDDNVDNKCDTCGVAVTAPNIDLSMLTMVDKTVNYTGKAQIMTATGTRPNGVTVEYSNNKQTDAGVYEVTAKYYFTGSRDGVNYNKMYLPGKDLTGTFTIKALKYDITGLEFNGKTVTYDGQAHSLAISGIELPEGLTVEYVNNGQTNAGVYTVTCKFITDKNHEPIADKTATLTINKATYNMSGIGFAGISVGHDGEAHSVYITGTLPAGVTVSYEGNGVSDEGVHTVTAKFTGDDKNYELIPDMTATIEIMVGKLPGISFVGKTVSFDGNTHSLEITGVLAKSYSVEYVNNGHRDAGEYTVTAKFYFNDDYLEDADLEAKLTINKAVIDTSVSDTQIPFDGEFHTATYNGTLPYGVTVEYDDVKGFLPGTYYSTIRFVIDDAEKNNVVAADPVTVAITITGTPAVTPVTDFEFDTQKVVVGSVTKYVKVITAYKGNAKYIVIPETDGSLDISSIASEAFKNNTNLVYVKLHDKVTNIGNNAFLGCTALTYVDLGNGLSVIGQNSFKNTAIKEIVLPDSLLSIGLGAFENVPLEAITLPFIGGSARTATTNTSNAYIGFIFGAIGYAGQVNNVPVTLKTVTLSAACKEIPAYSLYGCSNIENVIIGSGVEDIGLSAFQGMTGMKSIYIPKNVKTIAASAHDYNSPFFICNEDLLIVLEATSIKNFEYETDANGYLIPGTGFGTQWNTIEGETKAEYRLGLTYAEYLELIESLG